jgi:hypothetical protein
MFDFLLLAASTLEERDFLLALKMNVETPRTGKRRIEEGEVLVPRTSIARLCDRETWWRRESN